jgi:hypothetical protein
MALESYVAFHSLPGSQPEISLGEWLWRSGSLAWRSMGGGLTAPLALIQTPVSQFTLVYWLAGQPDDAPTGLLLPNAAKKTVSSRRHKTSPAGIAETDDR